MARNGQGAGLQFLHLWRPGHAHAGALPGRADQTRLVHAGSEMFHVYHLHGGGTRWRRNPFADDRGEFDQG